MKMIMVCANDKRLYLETFQDTAIDSVECVLKVSQGRYTIAINLDRKRILILQRALDEALEETDESEDET